MSHVLLRRTTFWVSEKHVDMLIFMIDEMIMIPTSGTPSQLLIDTNCKFDELKKKKKKDLEWEAPEQRAIRCN